MIDVEKFVQFDKKGDASFVRRDHEKTELQLRKTQNKIEENYKKLKKAIDNTSSTFENSI